MNKSVPFVPNAITAFGLMCGLFVIFKVSMFDPGGGSYDDQLMTVALLLLAAIADVLDGAVARAMKVESIFGAFFDSLADAITFGVAPSVIVLKSLSMTPGSQMSVLVSIGAMLYSLCGVLRLVRFNVSSVDSLEDPLLLTNHKKIFTGLPIPAGAAAVVSANLFLVSPFAEWVGLPSNEARSIVMAILMAGLGYLMISRRTYPSVKTLQIKISNFALIFVVVALGVLVFYGVLYFFPVVFVAGAWMYVLLGLLWSFVPSKA